MGRNGEEAYKTTKSDQALQINVLTGFEKGLLSDVTIFAEGREIPAHKFVLAAHSEYFAKEFTTAQATTDIQFDGKFRVVKQLIRFMYFGGCWNDELTPEDGVDILVFAEELGINAMDPNEIIPLILPRLTQHNCMDILRHPALGRYETLSVGVIKFVGENFISMLKGIDDYTNYTQEYTDGYMMNIPKHLMTDVLKVACKTISVPDDAGLAVMFVKAHTGADSVCDLLRETKTWKWGDPQEANYFRPPESSNHSTEWHIEQVQQAMAMEHAPEQIVVGEFFDWQIRLDYGVGNKLRIVYESARTPKENATPGRCINRFPAAMFGWRVFYKGKDVYDEKAVFICFPENVSLHWSTTLPKPEATELHPEDDLVIQVHMAENPMLSLILYYFSADLKSTVFNEDILNRLPHIEYRCLSSYSLVKTHIHEATAGT